MKDTNSVIGNLFLTTNNNPVLVLSVEKCFVNDKLCTLIYPCGSRGQKLLSQLRRVNP